MKKKKIDNKKVYINKDGHLIYNKDGISGGGNKTWYRGDHCNFNPDSKALATENAVEKYILKGWTPSSPFIGKKTPIIAFGSCFAERITEYLSEKGFSISSNERRIVDFRAGVNNTFAVRQLFDWVLNDRVFLEETWHDSDKKIIKRNLEIKNKTKEIFNKSKVFIITLGLSEVWYNKKTNDVFWRAIPAKQFNPDLHGFRVSTFLENKQNIQHIYDQIIKNNKNAKVIFTVSPVPLVATFRDNSCITSNSVSKSILRSAVDEFYRENNGHKNNSLFYWPSFEIVKEFFDKPYKSDNRHIKKECVDMIMKNFEKFYTIKE